MSGGSACRPEPRGDRPGSVVVQFDGGCQPPSGGGIATFGYTIDGAGFSLEEGGLAVRPYSERATNNVGEYTGAIRALERLRGLGYSGPVEVRGDSQLVIRQMLGTYAVRAPHLREYHARLAQLASQFSRVDWVWVPREQNGRADALAEEAVREHLGSAGRRRPGGPIRVAEDDPPPD